MPKPDYGIDAPRVVLALFFISAWAAAMVIYSVYNPDILPMPVLSGVIFSGGICFIEGLLMLLYAKWGKFRHRDRMLKLYKIRGNEQVLDVGTGKGLLMIGAAKQLINGRATGIDIWSAKDLSDNKLAKALKNAELEGVKDKVNVETADITHNQLPDNSFDLVVSNLCLHNIKGKEQRAKACREIHRLLATGGTAIISDFRNTRHYAEVFDSLHMEVTRKGPYLFDTFPPLTIVIARKLV
ncbi:MAG: class I SAM-dependent methyltransferase [Bacteroidetes bacterium]|nr:class I SAM-dependent methyltransferase [Bacteroidota bacterium]